MSSTRRFSGPETMHWKLSPPRFPLNSSKETAPAAPPVWARGAHSEFIDAAQGDFCVHCDGFQTVAPARQVGGFLCVPMGEAPMAPSRAACLGELLPASGAEISPSPVAKRRPLATQSRIPYRAIMIIVDATGRRFACGHVCAFCSISSSIVISHASSPMFFRTTSSIFCILRISSTPLIPSIRLLIIADLQNRTPIQNTKKSTLWWIQGTRRILRVP